MPLKLITVPCLSDNYAFLIGNETTGKAALIDVPEAAPINAALERSGWELTDVLLTHHHPDHVQGLDDLTGRAGARVLGAKADAHRLPDLDVALEDGAQIEVCGEPATVYDVSGHTIGHIAFHFPQSDLLFSGDSLMAMGCGRLFEGTPAQMWDSMLKLRELPDETIVCSGHEYTTGNCAFALSLEEHNAQIISRSEETQRLRQNSEPTVPSKLSVERTTNPFLRADDIHLKAALGMENADPVAVFAEVRGRKDKF